MNGNQKIALFGIAAALVTAFLSPIVYYDYKVDLCMRSLESSWGPAKERTELKHDQARLYCYAMVNGAR